MTTLEWNEKFLPKLGRLFPQRVREMNNEQLEIWWSKLKDYEWPQVESALDEYYASPKHPSHGATPSIAGIRAILRANVGDRREATDEALAAVTPIQRLRSELSRAQVEGHRNLSDQRLWSICCYYHWLMSCRTYGAYARGTVAAWLRWQAACYQAGLEHYAYFRKAGGGQGGSLASIAEKYGSTECPQRSWSEDAERHYREHVGEHLDHQISKSVPSVVDLARQELEAPAEPASF